MSLAHRYPPPPPSLVGVLGGFHAAMAVEWWWSSPRRSSAPAFRVLTSVGSHADRAHPMWLWAFLFTTAAAGVLGGLASRSALLTGIAVIAAGGLTAFYGVMSGIPGLSDPRAAFTGLIAFGLLAYWQGSVGSRLLGGNRPGLS